MSHSKSILCLIFSLVIVAISGCGGSETRQNPHSERFIVGESESVVVDTDTNTRNNDVVEDDGSDIEAVVPARNYLCPTGDALLSTAPVPEFIMAGAQGALYISSDGETWQQVTDTKTNVPLNSVVKGRNTFVAVGDQGTALCSPNGHDWFVIELNRTIKENGVERQEKETGRLLGVTTDGNQFVIVGEKGLIYTNTSNTEWTRIHDGELQSHFYDVAWGNGVFIAVGGDIDSRIGASGQVNALRSHNGEQWSVPPGFINVDENLTHISWTGDQFLIAGKKVIPPDNSDDVCEENCPTRPYIYLSPNGYSWTERAPEFTEPSLGSMKTAGLLSIDGDNSGNVTAMGSGVLEDGSAVNFRLRKMKDDETGAWVWVYDNLSNDIPHAYLDVLMLDTRTYVLASDSTKADLFVIEDNGALTTINISSSLKLNKISKAGLYDAQALCPIDKPRKVVLDVAPKFYGAQYVVVGEAGKVYTSPDAEEWKTTTLDGEENLTAIVRVGASFYTVGEKGGIYCSRSGQNWRKLTSGVTTPLTGVAANDNLAVVAGDGGVILTTVNGVQWDQSALPNSTTTTKVNGIVWANDRFIAVGGESASGLGGFIYTSSDGQTWSENQLNLTEDAYLNDIIWTGREFVAVGYVCTGVSPCINDKLILKSSDGVSWSRVGSANNPRYISSELTAVASRGNEIVVFGRGSVVLDSDILIVGSNNQITPWLMRDFSEAGVDHYNTLVSHEEGYFLVGNRGVFSRTQTTLADIDLSILGDLTLRDIAINGNPPITAVAGKTLTYSPVVWEPDGQRLEFIVSAKLPLPDWVSWNQSTGTLSMNPTQDDLGVVIEDVNIYVAQDTKTVLSDSSGLFDVEVVSNNPPVITGEPVNTTISVLLNETFYFSPVAYDLDREQSLSFSVEALPSWASFDTETGILHGTPSQADVGVYPGITVSVTDGSSTVSLPAFSLNIVYFPEDLSL